MDDFCDFEEYIKIMNDWVDGAECCDCRDAVRKLILDEICAELSRMAWDLK